VPEEVEFRTKPQIALELIDRALGNGVRVAAWTFDELYGRNGKFLDGLQKRGQRFVAEVPVDFHGWVQKPRILHSGPKNSKQGGRRKQYPRLARGRPSCEVRNLVKYSPVFRKKSWQRYRIKDTDQGPEVWEVKWAVFWRKMEGGLPGRRHCLIVARNVLSGEVKHFVANRVPGEKGITLRTSGEAPFDLVDVDPQRVQSGNSRFRVRRAGLPATPLVVMLLLQFFLVSFLACGGFQVSGREPCVRCAADLFHRQAIGLFTAGGVVFLTDAGTE